MSRTGVASARPAIVVSGSTPKLLAYVVVGLLALETAVVLGLPAIVGIGGPFLLAAVLGLALRRPPEVSIQATIQPDAVLEGDSVTVTIAIVSQPEMRADVALAVPGALHGSLPITVVRTDRAGTAVARFVVQAKRWGHFSIGPVAVRTGDQLGFFIRETVVDPKLAIRVHPSVERLPWLVSPRQTQVYAGNRSSRHAGSGVELADLRPYAPGDERRQVNWRATARSGQMWVTQRHPDRNSDVVVLLDTFGEATLSDAVRATAALASAYLEERDRVGIIGFGGVTTWVEPGAGARQQQRVIGALLDSQTFANVAWRDLTLVPARALPPHALVLVVSPLDDDRLIGAVADLAGRGTDLAVVVLTSAEPLEGEGGHVAYRLWDLSRRAREREWQRHGVTVVRWDRGRSLAEVIQELERWRQRRPVAR